MVLSGSPDSRKQQVASDILTRKGKILENYKDERVSLQKYEAGELSVVAAVVVLCCCCCSCCYHLVTTLLLLCCFVVVVLLFLSSFSDMHVPSPQITDGRYFVLSDDHCRTHKYLLGLALAIPCVSYDWVDKCIEQVTTTFP